MSGSESSLIKTLLITNSKLNKKQNIIIIKQNKEEIIEHLSFRKILKSNKNEKKNQIKFAVNFLASSKTHHDSNNTISPIDCYKNFP